jgi:hypothetical protein
MEMENLRQLYNAMQRIGANMQQFQYRVNNAEFDCLFVANQKPFLLCLTSRGLSPIFLKFKVDAETFEIPNRIDDDVYKLLAKLLRTDGSSGNKLIPKEFLAGLDSAIPTVARHRHVPAEDVIRLRPDITEHRNRPYFDTWIYWTEREGATSENQAKTLALMGEDALDHSLEFKCSSKWSATPTGREWKTIPMRRQTSSEVS